MTGPHPRRAADGHGTAGRPAACEVGERPAGPAGVSDT